MRHDLHNNIQVLSVFDPIDLGTGNTAKVGEIIDRQNTMALEFIIQTGSLADADATFTVLVGDGGRSRLSAPTAAAAADASWHRGRCFVRLLRRQQDRQDRLHRHQALRPPDRDAATTPAR